MKRNWLFSSETCTSIWPKSESWLVRCDIDGRRSPSSTSYTAAGSVGAHRYRHDRIAPRIDIGGPHQSPAARNSSRACARSARSDRASVPSSTRTTRAMSPEGASSPCRAPPPCARGRPCDRCAAVPALGGCQRSRKRGSCSMAKSCRRCSVLAAWNPSTSNHGTCAPSSSRVVSAANVLTPAASRAGVTRASPPGSSTPNATPLLPPGEARRGVGLHELEVGVLSIEVEPGVLDVGTPRRALLDDGELAQELRGRERLVGREVGDHVDVVEEDGHRPLARQASPRALSSARTSSGPPSGRRDRGARPPWPWDARGRRARASSGAPSPKASKSSTGP